VVSQERLSELLRAEVTHFSSMERLPLTLENLLRFSSSPRRAAEFVREEIAKRFAARISVLQEIEGWRHHPEIVELEECYTMSFGEVRMSEVGDTLKDFTATIERLKQRQKKVLPLLGQAMHRRVLTQEWMENFSRNRVATEMLTSQYMAVVDQERRGVEFITGIVEPACDPAQICERAANMAKRLCQAHTGLEPVIEVEVRTKTSSCFSFIPMYLQYILIELLKNSCTAMVNAAYLSTSSIADPYMCLNAKPISIVICSDDKNVAIRISDQAGGIPFEVGDKIWEYCNSGGERQTDYAGGSGLAGYGIGLPLARLYTTYLGGDLKLVSLPSFGVDTYLKFPRIDTAQYTEPRPSG